MATGGSLPDQSGSAGSRNRLGLEKSPYLLQHANNPVDWYPWGIDAFQKAKKENKPIFLSVGYSTCHWCHVMERESFENEDIGKFLNEHFVPVKVDREERPDVDKVYMAFIQATSGGGGWPMSVWLTPDLVPIVGGTYFPPDDRYYGRPGFMTMLKTIDNKWREDSGNIELKGGTLMDALTNQLRFSTEADRGLPPPGIVEKCYTMLERGYDEDMGGFSKAPKFPQPVNLCFLLRVYANEPTSEIGQKALDMCTHTLRMMANGGVYDHIAEGFHRYSTDNDWHVPHFEKMLYDQAQLTLAYAEAYQITKDDVFADVTRRILQYVNRDLSNEAGGFYSAEDADSYPSHDALTKKEGAFCVWTKDELYALINTPVEGKPDLTHADVFCFHYDVHPQGNVDPYKDPHDELKGQNVLIVRDDPDTTGSRFRLDVDTVEKILKTSKNILFEARKGRPPPHLDNKMITAWNGLMISGFAKAGLILGVTEYTHRGQRAADFVREHLFKPETGTLLRSCYCGKDGTVSQISSPIEGFVDDYAFLIRGLLDLYEASFDSSLLQWAEKLQSKMDELFWDKENGGYFNSSTQDKSIVLRLKEDQDGAEPNANSIAASNLLRLSAFLDLPNLREQAAKIFIAFADRLEAVPLALPEMVSAYMRHQRSPSQVIVVGDRTQEDTQALLSCVASHFLPSNVLIQTDVDTPPDDFLRHRLPVLSTLEKKEGLATAYICENFTCSLPVNSVEQVKKLLSRQK